MTCDTHADTRYRGLTFSGLLLVELFLLLALVITLGFTVGTFVDEREFLGTACVHVKDRLNDISRSCLFFCRVFTKAQITCYNNCICIVNLSDYMDRHKHSYCSMFCKEKVIEFVSNNTIAQWRGLLLYTATEFV